MMCGFRGLLRLVAPLCALAGLAVGLAACGTSNDGLQTNRYQLSHTQPGTLQNKEPLAKAKMVPRGPFAQWSAVIVAGDNAAAGGGTTHAFDNARRDLAKAFVQAGFEPNHIAQYSTDPTDTDPTNPGLASVDAVKGGLQRMLGAAGKGCLIYVTSHGNAQGIKFGDKLASIDDIAGLGDKTCGFRPTVMILSACHSGIFVQPLSAPNRLVMSAARSDRSSFGCGTDNKYPYFDECMIESLPGTTNFLTLADQVKKCVTRKEAAGHFTPPSEPQLSVGTTIAPVLASDDFSHATQTTMACAAGSLETTCASPPPSANGGRAFAP